MSVVVMNAVSIAAATSIHSHITSVGPAIWQGIMMLLVLPVSLLSYCISLYIPYYSNNDQERRLTKKLERIIAGVWITYVVLGIIVGIVIIRMNI